jgi:T1SS-143 domain-containing protein
LASPSSSTSVNEDDLSGGNDDGQAREPTTVSGSLAVSWGADDNNTGSTNDRSVAFDVRVGDSGLTSDGVRIFYTLSADGTVLTATQGRGGAEVFVVTLSDKNDGSYTFDLKGNIDHGSNSTNDSLTLNFGFTAKDSDGDTAKSSFSVTVVDDQPIAHTGAASTVEEESLAGGNNAPGVLVCQGRRLAQHQLGCR